MSLLSDHIEAFIKGLLKDMEDSVDIQRNELAEYFRCAPSQINYVLATRFNIDRGYIIQSRKGGGGYIRVIRLNLDEDDYVRQLVTQRIGDAIGQRDAHNIIESLKESGKATAREAGIIRAAVSDDALCIPSPMKDKARAAILKKVILTLTAKEV